MAGQFQTGPTNGHAHLYNEGDAFTDVFDDHDHSIPRTGAVSGPPRFISGQIVPNNTHTHTLPSRDVRGKPTGLHGPTSGDLGLGHF